ncbi:MAG: multifunctional CCA addition/repair protein [Gammaproteobacteria bacterium]|nr:multifunctional CCA addition/repair protein [Gammaproteobacteria bacterium]
MRVYLVGGAVRDRLLGIKAVDRDYVVVGATPEEMVARGFSPVGADFPVFLHPDTHEQYALARTERKTGPGYRGFTVHAAPDVTLEDDLRRRDLTINAMAEAEDGTLIDPFGGAEDLRNGVLRHVSAAFAEDPVRILRVARFAARYAKWGFHVAHSTNALMRRMVESGEADALVAERVWVEMERALAEVRPSVFFKVLRGCGALDRLFPEIAALFGVPQPEQHHPEVDAGLHVLKVLDEAASLTGDTRVRFAALMHDVGKSRTPRQQWPDHTGHEQAGVDIIREFCLRLRVPKDYRDLAMLVARYHGYCHRAAELPAVMMLEMLEAIDAFRRPGRIDQFLLACEADARGRCGFEDEPYPQASRVRCAFEAARTIGGADAIRAGIMGPAAGQWIRQERLAAIDRALR